MEHLYHPRVVRLSQVPAIINELDGIDGCQNEIQEDAQFDRGKDLH